MRILIVKLSSLGDVIHCLPCLDALKRGFPDAKVDWLVEEQNAGILEGHPQIDHLIILSRKSWMKRPWNIIKIFSEIKAFIKDLRSREYDMIIDFQGLFRSGLLLGLGRGKRKIGFDRVREMAHIFYNEKVPLSTLNQHAVTRYMEIPNYLKIKPDNLQFFLPISKKEAEYANKLLEYIGIKTIKNKRLVYINPNTRWPSKIWPWERFRELIKALSLKGYEVVLIGGPGDKDKMDSAFHGLGDRVHNLAGRTSIKSLAAVFKRGDCLITNDSGPMHLAVAVGLPVIAFFGPSNPLRTGPYGWQNENGQNKVLCSRISCVPCYKRECSHKECLMNISVDQVLGALEELLKSDSKKDMGIHKNILGEMDEIIIISMAKGWGGAEEYLENLTDRLSRKGINSHIIVRDGGEYSKRCANKDKIIELPHSIMGFITKAPKNFRRESPKIIHVNRYYDILRGWYLKKTIPNSMLFLYQQCYLNHPHRIPLSLVDGIICISEFVKTSIIKKFPVFATKTVVINSGIDLDLFNDTKKDYSINGPIKVGMVGRFDKNQKELIHVTGELKKRGIPITIHFAGSGKPEDENNLRILSERLGISENVVFRGSIPRQSMSHFYLEMDIVVSTMKREGLSLVAIEAMASGLPFIAYNAPGFNEVIDNEENGILVDGDVNEFASSLQFLIESSEARKRFGQNAIKKTRGCFGIETNVNRYLNFISDVLIKEGFYLK